MTILLARYLRNGRLDPQFGASGIVQTDISATDKVLAIQMGRSNSLTVLVATNHADAERSFDVVRYLENGDLDRPVDGSGRISNTFFPGSVNPRLNTAVFDSPLGDVVSSPTGLATATVGVSTGAPSGTSDVVAAPDVGVAPPAQGER